MKKITKYSEDSVQTICIFSDHDLNTCKVSKESEVNCWRSGLQGTHYLTGMEGQNYGRTELQILFHLQFFSKRWGTIILASKLHKMFFLDLEGSY